jgi:hypothetical protein
MAADDRRRPSVFHLLDSVYILRVPTHVRKNIVLPVDLDGEIRRRAAARGSTQSGLIVHLVRVGLAAEDGDGDPLLRYLGSIEGPADLASTVDETVYGR